MKIETATSSGVWSVCAALKEMPPKGKGKRKHSTSAPAPAPTPAPSIADDFSPFEGSFMVVGPIPIHGSPEREILEPGPKRRTRAAAQKDGSLKPAFMAGLNDKGKFTEWFTTHGLNTYKNT